MTDTLTARAQAEVHAETQRRVANQKLAAAYINNTQDDADLLCQMLGLTDPPDPAPTATACPRCGTPYGSDRRRTCRRTSCKTAGRARG